MLKEFTSRLEILAVRSDPTSPSQVRITAQLIDASTGGHLWGERYDRELVDIFALQDEISEKVVTALEVRLTESEQEQVGHRYTDNVEAYDLFLRGKEHQLRGTKGYVGRAARADKSVVRL